MSLDKKEQKRLKKEARIQEKERIKKEKLERKNNKSKATEKKEKAELGIYRLKHDKEAGDWVIIRDGAERASKRCRTKQEALKELKLLEKNQEVGSIIHKKDGKWQKKR